MSKVFIAWCGLRGMNRAQMLKKYLEESCANLFCVVGGNSHSGGRGGDAFINSTILNQMKSSDQAILLVERHEIRKEISDNLFFEWGYLLAQLPHHKIHDYFIDMEEDDTHLPSDLKGVWKKLVSTDGKTDEQVVREIGDNFLAQSLYQTVEGNKMNLVIRWDETKAIISQYITNPCCSNYEMAQYLLYYVYAAKLFSEAILEDALQTLEKFAATVENRSEEMNLALRGGVLSLNMLKDIQSDGVNPYLGERDCDRYTTGLEQLCAAADALRDGELKLLTQVVFRNFLTFAYFLMMYSPDFLPEDKEDAYVALMEESDRVVVDCNALEEKSADYAEFCQLFRAYMYRGIYCALTEKSKTTALSEEEEKKVSYCLFKSLEERTKLFTRYQNENVGGLFYKNIEMEYYLALAEYLPLEESSMRRRRMLRQLNDYTEKTRNNNNFMTLFVEKIRTLCQTG